MINTVCKVLESEGFRYQKIIDTPEKVVIRIGISASHGKIDCFIDVRPNLEIVMIFSTISILIPENKKMSMAEFINRANYGIRLGNFEMDYEDGDLRYKVCYSYDSNLPVSPIVFSRNLYASVRTLDDYIPGIMAVIYAHAEPRSAIAQIENKTDPGMN